MTILQIPVTKAGNKTIAVDTDTLHEKVYVAALASGIKTLVNGGATKLANVKDATTDEEKADFEAKAVAKAEERVAQMIAGTLKIGRAAAVKGPSAQVITEARRLARDLIRQAIKDAGGKVSHYSASEITSHANALLNDPDSGPGLITKAEENLEARTKSNIKIDASKIKEDPELVAKAEKAKQEKKAGVLSAAKAGKVAPRISKTIN